MSDPGHVPREPSRGDREESAHLQVGVSAEDQSLWSPFEMTGKMQTGDGEPGIWSSVAMEPGRADREQAALLLGTLL